MNSRRRVNSTVRHLHLNAIGMFMQSHKLVGAYVAVMVFVSMATCASNNLATMLTIQNTSVPQAVNQKTRTFDCRKSNAYRFVLVENPNRKKESDPVVPQDVNIVVGDRVLAKIELPKESEAKNFSLNATEKDKAGFIMKTDWGGGLYHYEVQFNFRCKQDNFYLYRVTKVSFSTTNPDSGNFLDKKESKVTKIEPNLPIERFVMTHYL